MKRRIRMAFMVVLSFAVLLVPSIAPATYVDLGPGEITGSWTQAFNESGVGNFTKIEAFMITPGVDFKTPGAMDGFSVAGWSGSRINPDYALGTGPATTNMNFNLSFTSAITDPITINLLAWNGTTFLERANAAYNGAGGWTFTSLAGEGSYDRSPVPIPGALILFGSGLLGLVGIGRKRLQK